MHALVNSRAHHLQANHCRGGGQPRVCSTSCDLDVPAGPLAAQKGYHVSFENPPSARSWSLDVVKDTMAAIGADTYKTDSCAWGHVDPESGKPVKKEQCVASTACLSSLVRRCTCYSGPGRCPSGVHQRVHGSMSMPVVGDTAPAVGGKCINRSTWAGAYPEDLCRAWAQVVRASIAGISGRPLAASSWR